MSTNAAALRRGLCGGGAGNVASPELGSLHGEDEKIEELKAELLVRWSGERCGGELGEALAARAQPLLLRHEASKGRAGEVSEQGGEAEASWCP
jgi:hypothetical protein